jgi:hypothetical protein
MKKVRAAIATAAIPTAGLMAMPAVAAHAATTQHARPAVPAAAPCVFSAASTVASGNGQFLLYAQYSYSAPGCFIFQQATLTHRMSGLTERVRIRSKNNKLLKQYRRGGTQFGASTAWWSSPRYGPARYLYATLVYNNTSNVYKGAIGIDDRF